MDQITTPDFFARNLFLDTGAETRIFVAFSDNNVFFKANLDQIRIPEQAKLGPEQNSTAYMYLLSVHVMSFVRA